MRKISILMGLIALVINHSIHAETTLPQSGWYAVIWNRVTDTLHWVNDTTELASMPRPQLPSESSAG